MNMRNTAKVVVIGGGVIGCSVLYHLAKLGWKDLVLVERSELTSGSSWHAAGGFHTLNGDPNVAKLQTYTIDLYQEIEELSGQSCGVHMTGGIMLAATKDRMDFLKDAHAKGSYLGMETELITPQEAKEYFPLIDPSKFEGAIYDPKEGHLDPSGTTYAYAGAAKKLGAEIILRNRVIETNQRTDGTWDVVTEQGTIHAEHIVNAGGLWARECGRMVGLELPILAMEHMYLITDDMPEVAEFNKETGREICHAIDFEGEIYMRQERGGMLIGAYEKGGVPWSTKTTPWEFGHELLQPDLDRIADSLAVGFEHCPPFENAGIKQIINGPFTFAPDGNPLIGPVRGMQNYWVACGVMAGFSQGGGVGLALANWMIDGDPGFDVWGMDVARYGSWTTSEYTNAKVRENYSHRFRISYPNEQLPAGRPLLTSPIYDQLEKRGAVFGDSAGLEQALWYAPEGVEPIEIPSFTRSNAFEHVAKECEAVRERVGLTEISGFAKYELKGAGARAWIEHIFTNIAPKPGRMNLCPMLNPQGKLIGDFTVACLHEQHYYIIGSGVAEEYHMRWFEEHLPDDDSVSLESLGLKLNGLSIAGPKARDVLAKLTEIDVSKEALKFMDFRQVHLGPVPVLLGRVSFTGDLGYEMWIAPEYMRKLFTMILDAGEEFGILLFGLRALQSLSIEKAYGSWSTEYRPIYGAFETGMGRFVSKKKESFIGRDKAMEEMENGTGKELKLFEVDADKADVMNDEPIWHGGKVVGWVTSGCYAHHVGKSMAMGFVPSDVAADDTAGAFEIEILGDRRPATLLKDVPFDPQALRMRG